MADWTYIEVEAIVSDYFAMLILELSGTAFNKSERRRNLLKIIQRTESSIEFKHQNISAILIKYGMPYVIGYAPRSNYQDLLETVVVEYLENHRNIEKNFDQFATKQIEVKKSNDIFDKWEVAAPAKPNTVEEPRVKMFKPVKRNYLEIEQKNRSVGESGEALVFEYEKWRLQRAGLSKLANEVKWVSHEQGDGAGYDILSKNVMGADIFIEVKSTKLGKETPIFFSETEREFSEIKKDAFFMYRVFNLEDSPKMFTRNGHFKEFCKVQNHSYKGYF